MDDVGGAMRRESDDQGGSGMERVESDLDAPTADGTLGPDSTYLNYLAAGRLMLQRSRSTGRFFFYPRVIEPTTGQQDLEWVEACGAGTIYSTTVARRLPERGGDYNIVLVDLIEGPRLMSCVDGVPPDRVYIGMPVVAAFVQGSNGPLLVFRPTEEGR